MNVINGAVVLAEDDLNVPASVFPLGFSRTYNSQDDRKGPCGWKWRHNYEWRVFETNTLFGPETNRVTNQWLVLDTGDNWNWKELPGTTNSGAHRICDGFEWDYSQESNGAYTIELPAGMIYRFSTNGVVSQVEDRWNNVLAMTYTNFGSTQLLVKIENGIGKALDLSYTGDLLTGVSTPSTNYNAAYYYNAESELTNVVIHTAARDYSMFYYYGPSNHVVTQRVDALNERFVWEYDGNKGVRSYVGTNYWFDTVLTHGSNGMNRTSVSFNRGDTNKVYWYEYHPLFQKITSISGPRLDGDRVWYDCPGTNMTNVITFGIYERDPDGYGLYTSNSDFEEFNTNYGVTANSSNNEYCVDKRFDYDEYGNMITARLTQVGVNTSGWSQTVFGYDEKQRLTNWSFGYGVEGSNKWWQTWNDTWNLVDSITDPEGNKVTIDYTNGAPSRFAIYPDGVNAVYAHFAYATNGLISAISNANGHGVQVSYDGNGNPITITPELGPAVELTYSSFGHLNGLRLPGAAGERAFDFEVDEAGKVSFVTWPDNVQEYYYRDGLGNVTNHIDRAGRSTRMTWHPSSKLASVTRVLTGATNQDATIAFDYDKQFNTLCIRDELNRAVEFYTLNGRDRPRVVSNIDSQQMVVTYGLGDEILSLKRFDGTTNSFSYNSEGLLSQAYTPGLTNTFTYLKNRVLRMASSGSGTISNAYDGANRLTQIQVSGFIPQPSSINYKYSPAGQVTNVDTIAGNLGFEFDAAERLRKIIGPAGVFSNSFNAYNGLISETAYSNGMRVSYGFDILDRITNIVWKNSTNAVLTSFAYRYNNAGMITNVSMGGVRQQDSGYQYDSLDRLVSENSAGSLREYSYDLTGNRLSKTADGMTVSYTLGTGNRLASWSVAGTPVGRLDVAGHANEPIGTNLLYGELYVSNAVGSTITAVQGSNFWANDVQVSAGSQQVVVVLGDAAGNVGRVTNRIYMSVVTNATYLYSAAGCVTNIHYIGNEYTNNIGFFWDGLYRLTEVKTNGVAAERNGYDVFGRRVWTWDGAETNWFIYSGAHIIADVNSTGGLIRTYVWGPGIDNLLAMTVYTNIGGTTSVSAVYYPIKDHLGTIHAFVDSSGAIIESYRYDAWGRVLGVYDSSGSLLVTHHSSLGNRYLWQGREYSWNTGFYYFRARWYDPVTGRWLSNDPIGISGGLNQYVFCSNNPINRRDPMGKVGTNMVVVGQETDANGNIVNVYGKGPGELTNNSYSPEQTFEDIFAFLKVLTSSTPSPWLKEMVISQIPSNIKLSLDASLLEELKNYQITNYIDNWKAACIIASTSKEGGTDSKIIGVNQAANMGSTHQNFGGNPFPILTSSGVLWNGVFYDGLLNTSNINK